MTTLWTPFFAQAAKPAGVHPMHGARQVLLLTAAMLAAGALATADVWSDVLHIALSDEEASHVLLAPIVLVWLLWVRRERFAALVPRQQWLGPLIVAVGWAASSLGFAHAYQVLWHGGAVLVLVGCCVTALGPDVLRRFAPAIAALMFVVPVPGLLRVRIAMPLQTATAEATRLVYQLAGIGVERMGNLISLNGKDIAIAEACNGMRMIFALLLVAYAIAFGLPLRWRTRVAMLLLSPVLAIICNVTRLTPTLWFFAYSDESLARWFHDTSGWAMLPIAVLLLLGVARLLERSRSAQTPSLRSPPVTARERAGVRAVTTIRVTRYRRSALWSVLLTVALLTAIASAALARPSATDAQPFHDRVRAAVSALPQRVGPWSSQENAIDADVAKLLQPNVISSRTYHNEATGEVIGLTVVQCRDARKLMGHDPSVCFPANGWFEITSEMRSLAVPGMGQPFHYTRYQFAREKAGVQEQLDVCSSTLLPDGRNSADAWTLRRAADDYTRYFFGAAQIEFVFTPDTQPHRQEAILGEFLAAFKPVLDVLGSAPVAPAATNPRLHPVPLRED